MRGAAALDLNSHDIGPILRGLTVTVGIVLLVELGARLMPEFRSPSPLLLVAIVYTAFIGGIKAGLLVALLLIGYAALYFSGERAFTYSTDDAIRLLVLVVAGPIVGVLVGSLKHRADRKSELALEHQRNYAASLLASMQDGLIVRDSEGRIVEVNDSLCRLTGFSRDELVGQTPPYPFWPTDHLPEHAKGYRSFMAGENVELDLTFCRKNGERFPVMATSSSAAHGGSDGARSSAIVMTTIKDITERKGQERRLTAQYAVARQLADSTSLPDAAPGILRALCEAMGWSFAALWLVDADARVLRCTHTYHANNIQPSEFEQAKRARTFQRGQGLPGRVWESGKPVWVKDVMSDPNLPLIAGAEKFSLHASVGFPVRVDRDVIGVIEFFHREIRAPDEDLRRLMDSIASQIGQFAQRKRADETLRHRANELANMARALKRSNEELDQFAYITSHDLKAPLRGISNLSTWIEEDMGDRFTDEGRQQMELLRGRVRRMESLIDGILEYSRIGRVTGRIETVDVAGLLTDVIDMIDPPAGFAIEVEPGMPTVVTDRLRLQQVFMNLLSNAIKHHHRPASGHVWITCRAVDEHWVEFAVRDDGPGIAPQYQDKIFVIFQRLATRDKVEGTGVGLSVVKKIVEHFGGTVRVESDGAGNGGGSTFRFTWPTDVVQQKGA